MTNFSIKMFMGSGKVKALVQKASKISQDFYPEQLGQMVIVNAPKTFTMIWAIIKAWLDEKTREKIQIKGSGYQKTLLKYVDEE
jgi:hypothetical protein